MKPLLDLLSKLRYARESGHFAALEPEEAGELLERFERRTNLLSETTGHLRGESMSKLARSRTTLVDSIHEELEK